MNTESIKTIKDFKTLAHFLAEELAWPIDPDNVDVDDLVFEYQPEDIGLSDEFAAKVQTIKQIRPLDANQPWSIFWIDFENKKLPLTVLRRILNVFVTKKRGNTRNIATKDMEDIMFVSGHGEDKNRAITFAHFKRLDDVETIREFYWDGHETKFDHIASYLEKLEWPSNTADIEGWRKKWKAAFTGSTREAITTSDQLARAMANIAKNIRDRILEVLSVERKNGPVHKLYDTFRKGLVHDMTEKGFADMYAQTITYGLFSARTMDTDGHFELHEVIDLIPTTNPFLKNLFKECLNTAEKKHKIDLDELGVGRLVELFDSLNKSDGSDTMKRILDQFGSQTFSGQEDPVIHFYEGFLKEYDGIQRVEKGVYYTPDPVVKFIVRSVNEQLKSEFGLEYGLADTTTWAEMVASGRAEYPVDPNTGKVNKDWIEKIKGRAFVQILDPATGTGTFLKHVIEVILEEVKHKFKKEKIHGTWEEYWNSYVYSGLLPRIYGFELMMASYSVAHMKLGMFLKSTGYKFEKEQRLNIYLTNSLEPHTSNNSANLFFTSVGAESLGANDVKKNRLFSVVIGNPPYFGYKSSNNPWIDNLTDDYKYVNGKSINEKKHRLGNDYVKFMRLSQNFISKNGQGIFGFINDHGFLFNPTFKGMRWSLISTYDKLFFVDLHGNSKKKEKDKDGSKDENVFDIQQGVSINIFIKMKQNKSNVEVKFSELLGKRDYKYNVLSHESIATLKSVDLSPEQPFYFFLPSNEDFITEYNKGFLISDLFIKGVTGTLTGNDNLLIGENDKILLEKLSNVNGEKISMQFIKKLDYRPFDKRSMYFIKTHTNNPYKNICVPASYRSRNDVMQNLTHPGNYCLIIGRQGQVVGDMPWNIVFIGQSIVDLNMFYRGGGVVTPLYIYPDSNSQLKTEVDSNRTPNLKYMYLKEIETRTGLKFENEKQTTHNNTFAPIDLLDYIYAVLHSSSYRGKYKEFLKIDFPRIPYPKDQVTFWKLVKLGGEIRQIHLLESSKVENFNTSFPVLGSNEVLKKLELKDNKVYINKEQYFDAVSEIAWNFYIGGYQPAQKWLKDRKGRALTADEINHYQKIIVALTETDRIMKEIDQIDFMEMKTNTEVQSKYYDPGDEYSIAAEPHRKL